MNQQQMTAAVFRSTWQMFLEAGATYFGGYDNLSIDDSSLVELGDGQVIDLTNTPVINIRGTKDGQERIVLIHPQGGCQVVKGKDTTND